MPISIHDFALQRDAFTSAAMRRVFCDESRLQRYLDFESALARVQARLGMIPAPAAVEIARNAHVDLLDRDALRARIELVGSPVLPLVEQLAAHCAGDFGNWCHWGATTQDVTDTATAMQMRDAFALIDDDLAAIVETLARATAHGVKI